MNANQIKAEGTAMLTIKLESEIVDLATSVTEEQIEALLGAAGAAGDRLQVAVCLVALDRTDDDWQVECLEEQRSALERLGIIRAHIDADVRAQAECARVIADAKV